MTNTKENEIKILLRIIENKTGFTLDDLRGHSRRQKIVLVRRAFFAIARKLLELTFEKIGSITNQNHTTVIYSLAKHNEEIDVFEEYTKVYHGIHGSLKDLYVARTEYNAKYMKTQIDLLITKRDLIDKRIQEYKVRIAEVGEKKK